MAGTPTQAVFEVVFEVVFIMMWSLRGGLVPWQCCSTGTKLEVGMRQSIKPDHLSQCEMEHG